MEKFVGAGGKRLPDGGEQEVCGQHCQKHRREAAVGGGGASRHGGRETVARGAEREGILRKGGASFQT